MAVVPDSRSVGALAGGGQVEVGEEGLVLAETVVLLRDRLLDLQQQVRGGPDLVGGVEDLAPAATYSSFGMADPRPASFSMTTWWPWRTSSCTPAGVIATRNSLFLTSRGMPTFTSITVLVRELAGGNPCMPGMPGLTAVSAARPVYLRIPSCLALQSICY